MSFPSLVGSSCIRKMSLDGPYCFVSARYCCDYWCDDSYSFLFARSSLQWVLLVSFCSFQVLDEAERSLHDAQCVVRCLVQKPFLIAGGGAPEIEVSRQLGSWAKTLLGMESYCIKAFAEAMEVRPHSWTCQRRLLRRFPLADCEGYFFRSNLHSWQIW